MGTKLQNEAKTAEMPREMSLEELDKLTRPSTAEDAFKTAAATPAAQSVAAESNSTTVAFEVPEGEIRPGDSFPLVEAGEVDDASLKVVAEQLRGLEKMQAPKGALEEVLDIRMEMLEKFNYLQSQIAELKTQHSGPKLDGDVMLAKMRGTIYCPECEVQLEGGSATAMANMHYTHPMGSAMPKPCSLAGARFEKPSVYLRRLPAAQYKKPIPA